MFELTKSVLTSFGIHQVYAAFEHNQGFQAVCNLNPDLVILDWTGPPLDSMALVKKIRSDPDSPNPFVPIILMSGYSQKERVLKARDSGITTFMAKPYTAKALYQRIEQLVEKPRQFVKSDHYFGPDRRSLRKEEYKGAERREDMPPAEEKRSARKTAEAMKQRLETHKDQKQD